MARVEWADGFLAALAKCGNVRLAARHVGVDHSTAYALRRRDTGFAARWGEAVARVERDGAVPLDPQGAAGAEYEVQGTRAVRVGVGRIGKKARREFLETLGATGSVNRAAEACGFSTQALHRRRVKDRKFRQEWAAALELGEARIGDYLMESANATFDPDALPIAADVPKMTTREAMELDKRRKARAGAARDEEEYDEREVEEARARIAAKIEKWCDRYEREKLAEGWTRSECGHLIPPGYGKLAG